MAQDTDVARVAAALRAPGIRYRSFGNEPVRTAATSAAGEFSLLGAGMAAAADVAAQQAPLTPAWQTTSDPMPAAWPEPPPPVAWPSPEPRRQDPTPPRWSEPAQPVWTESPTPSWANAPATEPLAQAPMAWDEPAPTVAAWPEPAPAVAPAFAPVPHWPSEPAPPVAEPATHWPAPIAAPAWTPAPPVAPPVVSVAPPVPLPSAPAAPALLAVAPAAPAVPRELSLLTAASALSATAPRPALSTLVALSTPQSASPAFGHAVPLPVAASPFPLIDALDLPGGFPGFSHARRAPPAAVVAPRPIGPLPAAAVDMPLAELFALLAQGPTLPEPAFAMLRGHPPRALGH